MKVVLVLLAIATVAFAKRLEEPRHTAYGYLLNYGVPRAEEIRKAEEKYLNNPTRIVGGAPAALGQYPYQAGLLIDLIDYTGQAACGASLITTTRLLTAAHCWSDGTIQAWRYTVVLGSVLLFSGGQRIETTTVFTHPSWLPLVVRNDIAAIYLPYEVATSATIAPVALPSGSLLTEDLTGQEVTASGFGLTQDGGSLTVDQVLSHVTLSVISNAQCWWSFPFIIQSTHLCTSGTGGTNPCNGDSGGPLVINRDGLNYLVGITSFGSDAGCQVGSPAGFTRVSQFIDFIQGHL